MQWIALILRLFLKTINVELAHVTRRKNYGWCNAWWVVHRRKGIWWKDPITFIHYLHWFWCWLFVAFTYSLLYFLFRHIIVLSTFLYLMICILLSNICSLHIKMILENTLFGENLQKNKIFGEISILKFFAYKNVRCFFKKIF